MRLFSKKPTPEHWDETEKDMPTPVYFILLALMGLFFSFINLIDKIKTVVINFRQSGRKLKKHALWGGER